MKSSEAQTLTPDELNTLRSLFRRWVLCSFPSYDGSSENSDAIQTYLRVHRDAERGRMREKLISNGESTLPDDGEEAF